MLYSVITFQICICIFLLDANIFPYINGANVDIYNFNVIRHRRQTQNTICPITQFQCDSGQCIDDIGLCDGKADCNDNSDENIKACASEKCPNISFMCNYGACIHKNGRCNGLRDCFDGSDEESCPYIIAKNVTSSAFEGCLHPNNPLHGKYDVFNHLSVEYTSNPGDIVPIFSVLFLNCNKGFVINPPEDDRPSYCLPTKDWNPPPKLCTRISLLSRGCRLPINPSHGKYVVINHLSARYIPGDIVPVYGLLYLHCNSGYVINPSEGDQPSYCLPTEEWTPAPKSCLLMPFVSKGCQVPNNPLYGQYVVNNNLSSNGYKIGDIAPAHSLLSVHCDTKFNPPADDEPSNCLPTGEWKPASKKCENPESSKKGCTFPYINPLHGKYTVSNHLSEYKPGDIVPINGLLSVNCNSNYKLNPPTDGEPSHCVSTGEWNPPPRICKVPEFHKEGCRFPYINRSHGKYTVSNQLSEHTPGDIIPINGLLSVNCNTKYEIIQREDNKPSVCLPTGDWSPAPQTCAIKRIYSKGCDFPHNPPNGRYIVKDSSSLYNPRDLLPETTILSVICNNGFEVDPILDDTTFTCLSGAWLSTKIGQLFDTLRTCIPSPSSSKRCQVPSNPPHGRYNVINDLSLKYKSGDFVPAETLLSVNCTTGYVTNPPETDNLFSCGFAGKWTPSIQITKCARSCPSLISTSTTFVECEFDSKPLNTCLNAVEDTIARISCAPSYEELSMKQYPTRLCKDGSWHYPIPQCYPSERF